jgi:integrase
MATVTRLARGNREGFRIRFYCDKRRRELYVSGGSKRSENRAGKIASFVEELSQAKAKCIEAAADAREWAVNVDGSIREKLVEWGLAVPVTPKLQSDAGTLLGPFLDAYITSRNDVKRTTEINYKQTRRLLVEYFGERKVLRTITAADGDRWRRWMVAKPLAEATLSKHCKRAKTMLAEAVKDRLLKSSPFDALKGGKESNSDRHYFIKPLDAKKILDACPDDDWRLIFALPRFAGLRCPSEVLGLKWSDVLWDQGRLRIDSPKTGLRFCPIFGELRPILERAFHRPIPEGQNPPVYVVGGYRGQVNLGTTMIRIVERAGVKPWPKTFVNLRSTRRTELQERFPDHVVNSWLGHSGKVAEKHYLQVTEEHWEQGAASLDSCPPQVPPSHAIQAAIPNHHDTKKPCLSQGSDGAGWQLKTNLVTPTGVEPVLPP